MTDFDVNRLGSRLLSTHSGPFGTALIEQQPQSGQHQRVVQTEPERCSIITSARTHLRRIRGTAPDEDRERAIIGTPTGERAWFKVDGYPNGNFW
jgi:hypothetical protein